MYVCVINIKKSTKADIKVKFKLKLEIMKPKV